MDKKSTQRKSTDSMNYTENSSSGVSFMDDDNENEDDDVELSDYVSPETSENVEDADERVNETESRKNKRSQREENLMRTENFEKSKKSQSNDRESRLLDTEKKSNENIFSENLSRKENFSFLDQSKRANSEDEGLNNLQQNEKKNKKKSKSKRMSFNQNEEDLKSWKNEKELSIRSRKNESENKSLNEQSFELIKSESQMFSKKLELIESCKKIYDEIQSMKKLRQTQLQNLEKMALLERQFRRKTKELYSTNQKAKQDIQLEKNKKKKRQNRKEKNMNSKLRKARYKTEDLKNKENKSFSNSDESESASDSQRVSSNKSHKRNNKKSRSKSKYNDDQNTKSFKGDETSTDKSDFPEENSVQSENEKNAHLAEDTPKIKKMSKIFKKKLKNKQLLKEYNKLDKEAKKQLDKKYKFCSELPKFWSISKLNEENLLKKILQQQNMKFKKFKTYWKNIIKTKKI